MKKIIERNIHYESGLLFFRADNFRDYLLKNNGEFVAGYSDFEDHLIHIFHYRKVTICYDSVTQEENIEINIELVGEENDVGEIERILLEKEKNFEKT